MSQGTVLLVDNGSLQPGAVLSLRRIARALGERAGVKVEPASILHSNRIPAGSIGGVSARTIEEAFTGHATAGAHCFTIVPLFFGPSRALTVFLPQIVARCAAKFPGLAVRLCPTLHQPGDDRLARIIADNVRSVASTLARPGAPLPVALVDHGSPVREVTAVRDTLTAEVGGILGTGFFPGACSMERREGAEHDFNDPLLSKRLATPPWNSGDVIVAMQFLQPGRHAGPDGDVARICGEAEAKFPGLRTHMTALAGESAALVAILADRLAAAGSVSVEPGARRRKPALNASSVARRAKDGDRGRQTATCG